MHRQAFLPALAALVALAWSVTAAQSPATQSWAEITAAAEQLGREGSHAQALERWLAARELAEGGGLELADAELRWLEFHIADCEWRAAPQSADRSIVDRALEQLRSLSPDSTPTDARDQVWAEARESLGDQLWAVQRTWNLAPALEQYSGALAWWGRSSDLELARERWLGIFWRMAQPPWAPGDFDTGNGRGSLPLELAQSALELARDDDEQGRSHLIVGRLALAEASTPRAEARAIEHLEAAIALGRRTSAHDDALHALGHHLERTGRFVQTEAGNFERRSDYRRAVALFRELVDGYAADQSRWFQSATNRLRVLTDPSVGLWVPGAFMPGSEVGYRVTWRNVESIDLALTPVDLVRDIRFDSPDQNPWQWTTRVDVADREPTARWTHAGGDASDHVQRWADLRLEPAPATGAYLLTARAGAAEARAVVLVTDASIVAYGAGEDFWLWTTRASDGEPIAGAELRAFTRQETARYNRRWEQRDLVADADGLGTFRLPDEHRAQALAVANTPAGPAVCVINSQLPPEAAEWGFHVTTDRPAYRPDQTVRYSVLARMRDDEGRWAPPAGQTMRFELVGPRGDRAAGGEVVLDEFGAAAGSFETTAEQTLGSYRLRLWSGDTLVGQAELFRLEEYVRPEFEVRVELPTDASGEREVFVLGDEVRAEVVAETYAGAPVAGAEVELVVRRGPHWATPLPRGPFAWFEQGLRGDSSHWWSGGGEEVLRTTALTDARGRAQVAFETWGLDGGDWEFTLEARVIDALRREVLGRGSVVVGEHAFRARVESDHRLLRPGGSAAIEVITEDLSGSPVAVAGSASLVRLWSLPNREAWAAAFGATRDLPAEFPHEFEEELLRIDLTTGADGRAAWAPTLPTEGAFALRFEARDERSGGRVVGETVVSACAAGTRGIGFSGSGVELIVDADTVAEGATVPVMLLADRSGRAVLLAVENGRTAEVSVVRTAGTAKLIELELDERNVPQTHLTVHAVEDGLILTDAQTLIVSPARRVLDVQASLAREQYEPGERAELELLLRDHRGEPVEGRLSVAIYDESLSAIQADLTADPRLAFYGEGSWWRARTENSMTRTYYARFRLDGDEGGWNGHHAADEPAEDSPASGGRLKGYGQYHGPGDSVPARGRLGFAELEALSSLGYLEGGGVAVDAAVQPSAVARYQPAASPSMVGAQGTTPNVRVDFRETALWDAAVRTDADGRATVELTWPDSTTRWSLSCVASDRGSRFGFERSSIARTDLPLLLRLATPRFLVGGDRTVVGTLLRNNTDAAIEARLDLATAGASARVIGPLIDGAIDPSAAAVTVPAGEEVAVDWSVEALAAGEARFVASVVSAERSDGIERSLPVHEHGAEVLVAAAGVATTERAELILDLPTARPGSTEFEVVVTPSLATAAIAALPYLADYPYGCLEQTLSRFVPAVVTLDALERLGLDRAAVAKATFDPPRRTGDPDPGGERTLARIDAMVADGLERVLSMQRGDGGFSWWPGGNADTFMSGYAVWSLALALDAGVEVPTAALDRGARWLESRAVEAEVDLELGLWLLHAYAAAVGALERSGAGVPPITERVGEVFALAFDGREALGGYGRALLLSTAVDLDRRDVVDVLVRNLADGVVVEGGGGGSLQPGLAPNARRTAHWGEDGIARRWSQDGTEATAFALRALLAVDPDHELVEPTIEWLVLNRRGARWKSTRDTAVCVLALVDAVEARDELSTPSEFWIDLDGVEVGGGRFDPDHAWLTPLRWPVRDVAAGRRVVGLRQEGAPRRLYWHVTARTFSIEERIAPRANEIVVRRDVYRLVGRETLLAGQVFDRVRLEHGDRVASGDRLETVVTLRTRAPLEYVLVEDPKAAGLEAVELQSGGAAWAHELRADEVERRFGDAAGGLDATVGDGRPASTRGTTGRRQWVYRELRDNRSVSFIDRLPEGTWELRNTLRAEAPGTYAALPARAEAMYAPDLAGNSWELEVSVD